MRQLALIAVKLAVSVALLYFALSRVNLGSLGERLTHVNPAWIMVAIAIGLLQIIVVGIRWQRIVQACGADLTVWQSFRFSLIGAFFGQALPSTVGGDAARIWLLARSGAGWRTASYSVLLDRFFGLLALAVLVTGGLYWSFQLIASPVGRLVLLTIGLGTLAGSVGFLVAGGWPILARWKIVRPIGDMAALARQLIGSRQSGPLIVLTSPVIHLMTAAVAWSVARAVAARLGFFDAFLLVLPVILIATVPISIAGWGLRESALVIAFLYAGLPESDGLVVSVLLGLVMLAVGLIGGLVWLASPTAPRLASAWESEQPPG